MAFFRSIANHIENTKFIYSFYLRLKPITIYCVHDTRLSYSKQLKQTDTGRIKNNLMMRVLLG